MTQIVKRTTTKEATQSNLDQDSNYGMTYLNRHFYNMSSMMLPLMVTDVKCSEWFLQYVNMTWMIQIQVIREQRRANSEQKSILPHIVHSLLILYVISIHCISSYYNCTWHNRLDWIEKYQRKRRRVVFAQLFFAQQQQLFLKASWSQLSPPPPQLCSQTWDVKFHCNVGGYHYLCIL